jgi:outer membrane protein assembly factor BamB
MKDNRCWKSSPAVFMLAVAAGLVGCTKPHGNLAPAKTGTSAPVTVTTVGPGPAQTPPVESATAPESAPPVEKDIAAPAADGKGAAADTSPSADNSERSTAAKRSTLNVQRSTLEGQWPHWRGPEETGVSREKDLPASWDPETGENLAWKINYGSRATPLYLNERIYIINNAGENPHGGPSPTEQERVMCFDAKNGETLWEHRFSIFHTDIPSNRVGWANLAGDPETGYVYAHGVQGLFFCFDKDGKVVWSHSLTEEFGRISGYGGRTNTPFLDGDLVMISFLSSSWGEHAKGGHRFVAFDKKTGAVVWISEPGGKPLDTTYSTPILMVVDGVRLWIVGDADGGLYAIKARTGEKVWGVLLSKRGLNVSPVAHGNLVYVAHSEENLGTNVQGSVVCIDATGSGDVTKTHIKWRRDGLAVGYASPVLKDGRLYVVDNAAKLICLNAEDGTTHWQKKLGTVGKGSPIWADGKLYATEVNGRFYILEPGEDGCKTLDAKKFQSQFPDVNLEIYGSPAVGHGRVYFSTAEETFALGKKDLELVSDPIPPLPPEPPADPHATPALVQVVPAEVRAKPGDSVHFHARLFDEKGRYLRDAEPEWSVKGVQGKISEGGVLAIADAQHSQGGAVTATVGELTGSARVRVLPPLPLAEDFEPFEGKKLPAGWVGLSPVKFSVVARDGSKVLEKLADNPQFARADVFIGPADLSNYTVEADVLGSEKEDQLPDMGLTANRYTLELLGNNHGLRIISWRPMPRVDQTVDFDWKPDTWYHMKLTTEPRDGKLLVRGKVWPRGEEEPEKWTVEVEDETPNTEGSPGIYAYSTNITNTPGTAAFFDNVKVTPNQE